MTTLARGETIMLEVVRRLETLACPPLKRVVRADVNPFQEAGTQLLIVNEPSETYECTRHPLCRATMSLPMLATVRIASQTEKASLVREVWLAIWRALLPPGDPNLGGLVVLLLPMDASMSLSKDPDPFSVLTMRWRLVYDFLLTDPTAL